MAWNLHDLFSLGFSGLSFCLQSKWREPEVCSLACLADTSLAKQRLVIYLVNVVPHLCSSKALRDWPVPSAQPGGWHSVSDVHGKGLACSFPTQTHHCRTTGSQSYLHTGLTSCTWHLPTGTGHGSYHGTVTLLCVCGLGIKPPALETGGFSSSFDPESQDMVCTDGGYPLSITRIPRVSPGLSGAAASPSLWCFRAIFFRSKMTLIN